MRRRPFALAALTALLLALPGDAGTLVDQGAGSAPSNSAWLVDPSAKLGAKTSECLVSNAAGGTACPAVALAGRRWLEVQNLGANAIYCTVDGSAPVVSKSRRIAPLPASGAADSWTLAAGPSIIVTCIAASAAQSSGAATIVSELR